MVWIRLDVDFFNHPKFMQIPKHRRGRAAMLWVTGLCYCARHGTDGRIPKAALGNLGLCENTSESCLDLIRVGLWLDQDSNKIRSGSDQDGDWIEVRSYLDYQPRSDEVKKQKQKRRSTKRARKTEIRDLERYDTIHTIHTKRNETTTSPEPKKSSPKNDPQAVITIPLVGDKEYPVTEGDVAEWREAYPGVDIMQSLRSMRQWCKSNPDRRKTKRGARRFVTAWLERDQNKGNNRAKTAPQAARVNQDSGAKHSNEEPFKAMSSEIKRLVADTADKLWSM